MKKGISLIVLVITIIVMIILTGAVILTLGNTGIITGANKSAFVSNIKEIMQDYSIYQAMYLAERNNLTDLNASSENIRDIIGSIPKDSIYEEKLEIINGTLTYMVDVKDKVDVERATWACEVGLKVNGMGNCTDIEYVETHIPAFEKVGSIYYNTPDLTGFNPEYTYYVTYDENGNEIIGNNILGKVPKDWFDYENKKWANIVVINEEIESKTYLVWVPRYAYKIDKSNKKSDVRFVNNSNVYIAADGTKVTYNDLAPAFDAEENQTNYIVNTAFSVNVGTEEEPEMKELSGFWISKYEMQEVIPLKPEIDVTDTEIIVYRCNQSIAQGHTYEFYLNNELIETNTTGIYIYSDLTPNKVYNVKILLKTGDLIIATSERILKTTGVPVQGTACVPDLGALMMENTYYLTWDTDGNEIRTRVIDETGNVVAAPTDWYDYTNKKWANIVVTNPDIGSETYLVWVPRYEYKIIGAESSKQEDKGVDLIFVPITKLEATPGYTLHPAFDVNIGTEENPDIKHMPGFWISKYEMQDVPTVE